MRKNSLQNIAEALPGAAVASSFSVGDATIATLKGDSRNNNNTAVHDGNDASPPTYEPSKELSIEDVYNPHNLTMEELENFLYEWEEEAAPFVTEYFDEKAMHQLRMGEKDETRKEENDKLSEDSTMESEGNSWVHRLRSKMTYDDGAKTKVEFKRGPTKYLNLSDDAAHVVEFYAPWCDNPMNSTAILAR